MEYMNIYQEWLEKATEDAQIVQELEAVKGDNEIGRAHV